MFSGYSPTSTASVYCAAFTSASSGAISRLEVCEFARRKRDIQLVGDPALIADRHDAQRLAQHVARLVQDGHRDLEPAQIDVGAHHVGDDRGYHVVARSAPPLAVVGARRLDLAAVFAEHIELPDRIESRDRVDVLQAAGVVGRDQRLLGAPAREIAFPCRAPAAALASTSGSA